MARQNFNDFSTGGGTGIWLYCDGRTLSITGYPTLFAVLGYFYGGSGASFNIPDLRERVVAGASSSEPINKKEGAKTHTLTQAELPNYNIPTEALGNKDGLRSLNLGSGFNVNVVSVPLGGGDQPHNNMQPTIYLPYFIYAL